MPPLLPRLALQASTTSTVVAPTVPTPLTHPSPCPPSPPSQHNRYEHYLPDEKNHVAPEGANGGKADSFTQMFFSLQHNLTDLIEKSEEAGRERDKWGGA